jgi:hypothetical protein
MWLFYQCAMRRTIMPFEVLLTFFGAVLGGIIGFQSAVLLEHRRGRVLRESYLQSISTELQFNLVIAFASLREGACPSPFSADAWRTAGSDLSYLLDPDVFSQLQWLYMGLPMVDGYRSNCTGEDAVDHVSSWLFEAKHCLATLIPLGGAYRWVGEARRAIKEIDMLCKICRISEPIRGGHGCG